MSIARSLSPLVAVLALAILAACVAPAPIVDLQPAPAASPAPASVEPTVSAPVAAPAATAAPVAPMGRGLGFGRRSGMMERHHATIPAEFASLENPIAAEAESLARGETLYTANCTSCHGDTGMGEGPAGQQLDPPAAPIAHTSQMLSDGYLFWRITEGGHAFDTAMPVWKDALDEQARWDLVNYMRSLEAGSTMGQDRMGRGPGPQAGAADHRATMLADAVAQGVLTQEEVDFFERVHQVLDERYAADTATMAGMGPGGMMAMQRGLTSQAVRDGYLTQEEADRFTEIHDRLVQTGVMQ